MRLIDADELKKHIGVYDGTTAQVEAVEVQYIDNAPTVLADNYSMGYQDGVKKVLSERPHGHWIVLLDEDSIKTCKCSICGRLADIVKFDNFPYCHCGADMRGES